MTAKKITLDKTSPAGSILVHHGGPRITDPFEVCDGYTAAYAAHSAGTLDIDGAPRTETEENDVFLIAPGSAFRFLPVQGVRRIDIYYCHFMPELLSARLRDSLAENFPQFGSMLRGTQKYIRAADGADRGIRDIFIRMIDEDLAGLPCCTEALTGALAVLLIKLLRAAENPTPAESRTEMTDDAIRYIHKHMYEKISLAEIAEHLKLSPSFVCRRFKADTGMTTSQFINRSRVEKIKDILKNTSKPAELIPDMFSCSPEHLKRVFKSLTGMSMTEYRDRYNYKRPGAN